MVAINAFMQWTDRVHRTMHSQKLELFHCNQLKHRQHSSSKALLELLALTTIINYILLSTRKITKLKENMTVIMETKFIGRNFKKT